MDAQEIIKKTRLFGLNTYEARLWAALLSKKTASAGELSDISNVPRSRSYDVLQSLEKKGFVDLVGKRPLIYEAVPPREVLERVKDKVLVAKNSYLDDISSKHFLNLIDIFQKTHDTKGGEGDSVAIIRGRKNIFQHAIYLLTSNRPGRFPPPRCVRESDLPDSALSDRGSCIWTLGNNTLIFPLDEKAIHPEFDLCIWIKHKQITKFLDSL
jgi:predicted transcriptional regulator